MLRLGGLAMQDTQFAVNLKRKNTGGQGHAVYRLVGDPGGGDRAFGLRGSKFKRYNGPEVTQVQVHKADRKMYLIHNERVLKSYDIALGFAPEGHKQFEGDGKTPEGQYFISHKNPDSSITCRSAFPTRTRRTSPLPKPRARRPGGDIFIHGGPEHPRVGATGPGAASP
jgi:murein L,D-transpeptidase YafK